MKRPLSSFFFFFFNMKWCHFGKKHVVSFK
jgi:hypothetical protein